MKRILMLLAVAALMAAMIVVSAVPALAERRHPLTVEAITRDDVRAFIADQLDRWKPLTALNRYRGLQAFFKWAVAEGELEASPMAGMNPPQIPDEPFNKFHSVIHEKPNDVRAAAC